MTDLQETQIRNYLLMKKLPIDILLEVQDHFITQITNLELEKGLPFEDAFKNVKENWRKDLTLSWAGGMTITDSNLLMRRISKNINKETIFISLKFSGISIISILFLSIFLPKPIFQYFVSSVVIVIYLIPFLNFIINFKKFWLPRKYDNYTLTLHQGNTSLILGLLIIPSKVIENIFSRPEYFQFFGNVKVEFWIYILSYSVLFLIFSLAIFTIISQIKFLRQLEIVKPFLKYLKPS